MVKFIRGATTWGIQPTTPPKLAQHFRLTNSIFLLLFFGSFVETAVCYLSGNIEAAILNSSAPVVFGIGLILMKAGRTTAARAFVILVGCIGTYALCASLGPNSYYQMTLLFASTLAILFFSVEEKFLLLLCLITPVICFVMLELTHYEPIFGMSRQQLGANQLLVMRILSLLVIWSIMILHFAYFVRDRRKSQEQLVTSAKMAAMGRMAAGIAHEINNPLQLIVSSAERLKLFSQSSEETQKKVILVAEQIQTFAMRIASINKGLLALSRDAANDPFESVAVKSVIDLALDYFRAHLESNRIDLRVGEIPSDLCVRGRETQLSQVVTNLLNNAYDAVLEKESRWIQIDVKDERDWIEIAISDSGDGIEAKLRQRIFDPFFTTKPVGKGTGLGLSISQGIVSAHGGQIYYDHTSLTSRFVVRLPRAPDLT